MDFTKNYYTITIPELNFCILNQFPASLKVNLGDVIEDIADPKRNSTTYNGTVELNYAQGKKFFYHFNQSQLNPISGEKVKQHRYFDTVTMKLKYMQFEAQDYVYESTDGLVDKKTFD